MVDTGFLKTVDMLRAALGSLGVPFSGIEQIIITHGHVDHYGGAAAIRRESGRPVKVFAHREDAPNVEQRPAVPERIARRFYRKSGLPLRFRLMMRLLRRGFKSMAEAAGLTRTLRTAKRSGSARTGKGSIHPRPFKGRDMPVS
jgi:mRNA degradation ribonuclease J1/J2